MGNSPKFRYLAHSERTDTIMFETNHNNYIRTAGASWGWLGCIPMGGSFSAQAATCTACGVFTEDNTNTGHQGRQNSRTKGSRANKGTQG